ncbi:MAG TPA: ribonuclease HII [Candidatus Aminicenantes bacterium]|nr:ribonuclease HII [Candidatus Aminicenantes bacterium]
MADFAIEAALLRNDRRLICGLDEVGRGCLFGPVVAGAVILDPHRPNPRYDDSKKLSPRQRQLLARDIYRTALAYSIGWSWNDEIDRCNILEATRRAMGQAFRRLQLRPDFVLIDAIDPGFLPVPGRAVIGGDGKSLSIAAASIIAKVFRDRLLEEFAPFFPEFDLGRNKGYPTPGHQNVLSCRGETIFHRRSFRLKHGG